MNLDTVLNLSEIALGAFGVGWVNDTYVSPAVEQALPMLQTDHTFSKVADTASCAGTAIFAGKALKMVKLDRIGRNVSFGGLILAAMKGVAVAVPGAEVKTTVPSPLSLFRSTLATNPAPGAATANAVGGAAAGVPQLTAGPNGAASTAATAVNSGFGMTTSGTFLNVPAPAAANLDWGI